jgi:hypothetical protein
MKRSNVIVRWEFTIFVAVTCSTHKTTGPPPNGPGGHLRGSPTAAALNLVETRVTDIYRPAGVSSYGSLALAA